jgi:hypothetical protein
MKFFVRAYLRASTDEQDAQRARGTLARFADERGVVICNYYAENESGARLDPQVRQHSRPIAPTRSYESRTCAIPPRISVVTRHFL